VPPQFRARVSYGYEELEGPPWRPRPGTKQSREMPYVWRGMTIVVVPWFSGMLLLPDLDRL